MSLMVVIQFSVEKGTHRTSHITKTFSTISTNWQLFWQPLYRGQKLNEHGD